MKVSIPDCYIRPSRRFKPGIVSPINGPSFDAASSPMDCQVSFNTRLEKQMPNIQ